MSTAPWELGKQAAMMAAIVQRLRTATKSVSGEELSRDLGAVRNSVWKCVENLRSLGYEITGAPHEGYKLVAHPDQPFPWEAAWQLETAAFGRQSVYYPTVTSTNDIARQMAREGAPHGLLVVADTQSAGRGRRGRTWLSAAGTGLWFSIVLRPALPPSGAALFPLMTGAAVVSAVNALTGLHASLKWPNDVLVGDKKVSGVLLEMSAETDAIHHLVLGIGINVNGSAADFPPELQQSATTLQDMSGRHIARIPLLQRALLELEKRYQELLDSGSAPLLAEVRRVSHTLGRHVDVHGPDGDLFSGVAVDIENDGALRVRDSAGREQLFYAGDVSVRNGV